MTGSIFPPLPPPLPKTAPLPSAARAPMTAFTASGASPSPLHAQKAAPVAGPATRKFGTVLTKSAAMNRAPSPVSSTRKAAVDRDAAARRYYHQYQYTPRHGIQKAYGASAGRINRPQRECDKENADPSSDAVETSLHDEAEGGQVVASAWDNYVHRAGIKSASGRSVWSVTPEELAQIAGTMRASLKYPSRSRGMAFQKFYALPVFELTRRDEIEPPAGPEEIQEESTRVVLDYHKACSLSAESPSFFPMDNSNDDPTSELMQMLKTTLSSKKIAPHMDWWPGDWKCKKCGNHNFSYRETCKRCRVGRFEDAGFVYTPSSARQSAAA